MTLVILRYGVLATLEAAARLVTVAADGNWLEFQPPPSAWTNCTAEVIS